MFLVCYNEQITDIAEMSKKLMPTEKHKIKGATKPKVSKCPTDFLASVESLQEKQLLLARTRQLALHSCMMLRSIHLPASVQKSLKYAQIILI